MLKVLVACKRVVDYNVKVRVDAEQKGVVLSNVKMSLNPFCEIAVEEAIRLKDKKVAGELIAVSIGPKQCQETLRTAMAMGIDRAVLVETNLRPDQELQPLAVARALKAIAEREKVDLILVGKQSIDDDFNHTGQMLAGLLDWPQATFASSLQFSSDHKAVDVVREVDGGLQTIHCSVPLVVSADLRLNEPRYVTLPSMMKARKKPIETVSLESLQIDSAPHVVYETVQEPPQRQAGVKVTSVDELLQQLKAKGAL